MRTERNYLLFSYICQAIAVWPPTWENKGSWSGDGKLILHVALWEQVAQTLRKRNGDKQAMHV